jgi:hypothetical protein
MINTSPKARQVLQPVFDREYVQTFFNTRRWLASIPVMTAKLGNRRTTLLGSDSVDGIVRVTLSPDLAADGNGGSLALDGLSLGIDIGDLDLDGSVVLGRDQSV